MECRLSLRICNSWTCFRHHANRDRHQLHCARRRTLALSYCTQLHPSFLEEDVEVIESMVARDGVEPPTPAFSDLVQPEPITTYWFAGDCQGHRQTPKGETGRA